MSQMTGHGEGLSSILILVRVSECHNFTDAAKKLGITASGVSRAVSRLERRLGVQLVKRTTRTISLSDEGAAYVKRCRQILAELEDADSAIASTRDTPRGVVHVRMPAGFGRKVILPALPAFLARYPELRVEVELSGETCDLAEHAVDVAVRFGQPGDSRVVARKLLDMRFATCASPQYLQRCGAPRSVDELAEHRCLTFVNPRTGREDQWVYTKDGQTTAVTVRSALRANDVQTLVDAAIEGAGVINVAAVMVADAIADGRLQRVLPDHVPLNYPVFLMYLPSRYLTPRVRAFIDFAIGLVPEELPWDRIFEPADFAASSRP